MHPIVKFLPHWSQLNLFFHEQQYYVPSIQYCVWNICHTHHICNFLNPLWTFSICTFSFQWSLFYNFYIWILKVPIMFICMRFGNKLNVLVKYLPQCSQFNSWINFMNILYENFQIASSSKILATLITIKFALICNFSPVFCVKFLSQWSQLNSTICINTFKLHPIVKFLPHWSQLNLFFHEQQYYVPSIQYCVWNFFKSFMDIFHMHFFFPMISFLQILHLNSQITDLFYFMNILFMYFQVKCFGKIFSWIFCICNFKLYPLPIFVFIFS